MIAQWCEMQLLIVRSGVTIGSDEEYSGAVDLRIRTSYSTLTRPCNSRRCFKDHYVGSLVNADRAKDV